MNIDAEMVKRKEVAGSTRDGKPIVFIETHGGLYAFFAKKDSEIKALGVGAHIAIAKFMAEKENPGIIWQEDFIQKNEEAEMSLQKSENQQKRITKLMFDPETKPESSPSDFFFVYHMPTRVASLMKKEKIEKYAEKGFFDDSFLVRDTNLTTIALPPSEHPSFGSK